jgi:uncharacterized protein (TIGR02996 family)
MTTHNQQKAFQEAIEEHPTDLAPCLAYAGWLAENDYEEAEPHNRPGPFPRPSLQPD